MPERSATRSAVRRRHRRLRRRAVGARRRRPGRRPHRLVRRRRRGGARRARCRCASPTTPARGSPSCPAVEPLSADGEALVEDVRDLDSPFDEVLVGGQSAAQVDSKDVVFDRLPWAIGLVAVDHARRAVPAVRQRARPDQGAGAQLPQPDGDVRGDGVDLPGRQRVRAARLHRHRRHRRGDADPDVLHRLRAVDGLRGVPPVPDQGRARPGLGYGDVRGDGVGAHRADRHGGGRADRRRVPGLRHRSGVVHEDVRHRADAGRARRRVPDPLDAGAGVHAPGRRRQLVGARPAAAVPRPLRDLRARRPRRRARPS